MEAFVFAAAFCKADLFLTNFLLEEEFFLASFFLTGFFTRVPRFAAVFFSFVCFFLVFLLAAIGAVYHRRICAPNVFQATVWVGAFPNFSGLRQGHLTGLHCC